MYTRRWEIFARRFKGVCYFVFFHCELLHEAPGLHSRAERSSRGFRGKRHTVIFLLHGQTASALCGLCYMEYKPSTIIKNECRLQPLTPLTGRLDLDFWKVLHVHIYKLGTLLVQEERSAKGKLNPELTYATAVPTSCRVMFPALTSAQFKITVQVFSQ